MIGGKARAREKEAREKEEVAAGAKCQRKVLYFITPTDVAAEDVMAEEDVEKHGSGLEVDWEGVPDSAVVPIGNYLVAVDTVEAGMSKNTGKLMYSGTFRIEEPKEYANLQLKDFYVLGSDDDPTAGDPKTARTSIGMQRMKNLFKSTNGTMGSSLDTCCREAEGQQVMVRVILTEDKQAKGQYRNNIQRYFPLGEREPGIDDTDAADKGPKQLKGTAAARRATPPARKGDEEEGGAEEATAPAPAAKKAAAAPTAAKKAAPPAAAAAANGKPKPAEKAAEKVETKNCPLCDQPFARADLKQHMLTCEAEAGEAATE